MVDKGKPTSKWLIPDPELDFIFTISLDGRMNMLSILRDMKKNGDLERLLGKDIETEPLNNYFTTKEKFFKKLLSGGCGKCARKMTPVDKETFGKELLGTLFDAKVIKQDDKDQDYVYFDKDYIEDTKRLKKQLEKFNISETEKILKIYQDAQKCKTKYINIANTKLSYFVDSDFLGKSVLGCWILNNMHMIEKDNERLPMASRKRFKKIYEEYYAQSGLLSPPVLEETKVVLEIEKNGDKTKEIVFSELFNYICLSDNEVKVKLFSNGSISILVRLKFSNPGKDAPSDPCKINIEPHSLVKLIQFPNMVVPQYKKQRDNKKNSKKNEPITGFLNYVAYDIANNVFNVFFECLKENREKDTPQKSLVDYLEIERVQKKRGDYRYTVLQRYIDGRYTDNENYIQAWPYVGVMFDRPNNVNFSDDDFKLVKTLVGIATQTEEFIEHLKEPKEYLKQYSLTRGSQDAIIIEKRGFVACGIRKQKSLRIYPASDRKSFLDNPFATLIFAIETIMATVKSVNAFNKELEEYVSPAINDMLHRDRLRYKNVREFRKCVSKARALSPCEDFSSNLISHLRSKIAVCGAERMQSFALINLTNSVQHRLDNYGHFLKTAHEDIIIRKNRNIEILMVILAIVLLLLTLEHDNMLKYWAFLKDLVFSTITFFQNLY